MKSLTEASKTKGVSMNFCKCPRCGTKAFENLQNYSHCLECLYFEDRWVSPYGLITDTFAKDKSHKTGSIIDLGEKRKVTVTGNETEEAS